MAGGGGGGHTTVENIPEWMQPYLQGLAEDATAAHESGELGQVAGFNETQKQGLDALTGAANAAQDQYNTALQGQGVLADQAAGKGVFSQAQTQGLKDMAIRDAQGALGQIDGLAGGSGVGGARSALLKGDVQNNLAHQFAQFDYDALRNQQQLQSQGAQGLLGSTSQLTGQAGAAADYLGQAGQAQQDQSQAELDSTYTGLAQLGQLLGVSNPGVTHMQKGGK